MVLPNGVTEVNQNQVMQQDIDVLVIPSSVQVIGRNAFFRWNSLKKIQFAKNGALQKIEAKAFSRTCLRIFVAPPSLREIGQAAFHECTQLTTILLNDGLDTIGADAFGKSRVKSVIIPASVQNIRQGAFQNSFSLESVTFAIGSMLSNIGPSAFTGTALRYITVPLSATIAANAFDPQVSIERMQ